MLITHVAAARALGMAENGLPRRRWRAWWPYPTAVILSLIGVVLVMHLWQRPDLRLPFAYRGETLYNGMLVKGILDYGWHLSNPNLAAPTGLDLRDVPMSDNNLHFALIWPLRLVTSNYARAMNAYFLLTFPLIALAALYVFLSFGLAAWPALCGSLLYAFLPFHFDRGQHHLFLTGYYVVPLAVMVALWITAGALSLADAGDARWHWRPIRPKLIWSAIICVLLGSGGVYYAFFACFFFLVAAVVVAIRRRRVRELALPVALVGLTTAVLTANYLPSILYLARYGDTPAVRRSAVDAETYGLKISQLLFPATGHRLTALSRFKDAVNSERGTNETDSASLGMIGSVGFLALLCGFVLKPPVAPGHEDDVARDTWRDLSIMNLSAVLLSTIGGFGSLVALLVTSKIRAYNRISIYIAFFSLFAIVIAADYVYRRPCRGGRRRVLFCLGLAVLLGLGIADQTTRRAIPDYARIAFEWGNDGTFIERIEAAMPRGAMIFQLPAVGFPEHPRVHRMDDYDHARGYLRSRHLRWSYGAMRGRDDDVWQRWVADQPPRQLVETLAAADFSGLYVSREAYRDGAVRLAAEIGRVLDQSPIVSGHDRFLFFDLTAYRADLQARHTPAAWEAKREAALHPMLVNWQKGCWELESDAAGHTSRWCSSAGSWRLINGARQPKRVTLEMTFTSPNAGELSLEGPVLSTSLRVDHVGRALMRTITVPPGVHVIDFRCTAPRLLAVRDGRQLVFRVDNFRMIPAAP